MRSFLAEPFDLESAICGENDARHARVIVEHHGRLPRREEVAQFRAACADVLESDQKPVPLVDENGVAFVPGVKVVSMTELWRTPRTGGPEIMVAGWRGVLETLDQRNVGIRFEGIVDLYLIRRDRLKATLKVAEGSR